MKATGTPFLHIALSVPFQASVRWGLSMYSDSLGREQICNLRTAQRVGWPSASWQAKQWPSTMSSVWRLLLGIMVLPSLVLGHPGVSCSGSWRGGGRWSRASARGCCQTPAGDTGINALLLSVSSPFLVEGLYIYIPFLTRKSTRYFKTYTF